MWVLWNRSQKPAKVAELFVLGREVFGGEASCVGYGHRPAFLSGVQWNELVWSEWLTGEPLWKERVNAKGVMCSENGGIQSCPESCQSLWLRYDSWAHGFVRKRSTVDGGGVPRPAKTCQKIPKKTPLSAESYRRQDWRKYADSRGDPNRSSVAETKTRMSEILSELTSQSHVLKVVENSHFFLILIIPNLLVSMIRW